MQLTIEQQAIIQDIYLPWTQTAKDFEYLDKALLATIIIITRHVCFSIYHQHFSLQFYNHHCIVWEKIGREKILVSKKCNSLRLAYPKSSKILPLEKSYSHYSHEQVPTTECLGGSLKQ
jgi:hypothetical protein